MKVGFINTSLKGGGAERVTVNLANGLVNKNNIQVYIFTPDKDEGEYELEKKIYRKCIMTGNLLRDAIRINRELKKNNINICVGMGIYSNWCVGLMKIINKNCKFIISERNAPSLDNISNKSRILRFLLYRNADAYVFQTKQAKSFYSKKIQNKGYIIHNPIKDNLPYRANSNKDEIVAIGRLMKQKNYNLLIGAMTIVCNKYPNYKLKIYGKGKLEELLKETVKRERLEDNIKFMGYCEDIHKEIVNSKIFVMSSDFEGMPNALMEAMAMGFPVVSTDCPVGGPAELIISGENGILVDVNNKDMLANAIINIIEDKHLEIKISNNAKNIRITHSIEEIINNWMIVFKNLMEC